MSEETTATAEATEEKVELTLSDAASKLVDEAQGLSDEDRQAFLLGLIAKQNMLWVSDFVTAFENYFDVSAAAPAGGVVMAGPAADDEAVEQTEFDVVLKEAGGQKIQVIKVVRAATSLGLKEAKALVDGAPAPIKEGVSKDEADELKQQLEDAGGLVEIK